VDGALERVWTEQAREVEEGARHRGDGQLAQLRDVVDRERTNPICLDAGEAVASPARDQDLRPRASRCSQSPCRGRPAMAEHRGRPARQHGGHPRAVGRQQRMSDRVDAAVDAVQATRTHAVLRRARAQAGAGELGERHDAVLARGQPGDQRVRCAGSTTPGVADPAHRPSVRAMASRRYGVSVPPQRRLSAARPGRSR
jgi:hypothetical protein